jgi:gluconate 5-dehydrogenase
MMMGILPDDPVERAKRGAAMPAMRIGEVDDCKGPVVFLASAAPDFITGSTIYPDGGLTSVG